MSSPVTSGHSRYKYLFIKRHPVGEHGRHCEGCKQVNANYKRDKTTRNRIDTASKTKEAGTACLYACDPDVACGVPKTYEYRGCRGGACRKAALEREQDYKIMTLIRTS